MIGILLLPSCNVLELDPLDKYSEPTVWSDGDLMRAFVYGQYGIILSEYGENVGETASDNLYAKTWGNGRAVLEGSITADNVNSLMYEINSWPYVWGYIRNYNDFLERVDDCPVDEDLKRQLTGETKFLRAWAYGNLIVRFGGVLLITRTYGLNEDYNVARSSFEECLDFVIKELDEATALLGTEMQPESERGVATGHACMAVKARLLLYAASPLWNPSDDKAKWQLASDAAAALLNAADAPAGVTPVANYTLEDNYQEVFLKSTGNTEIIFARYFTQNQSNLFYFNNGRNGSGGLGATNPTQNMVNAYEMANGELPYLDDDYTVVNPLSGYDPADPYGAPRDPRFEMSILHDGSVWQGRETETFLSADQEILAGGMDTQQGPNMPNNATETSYYLKKFIPEDLPTIGSATNPTNPYVFYRYAEVLLNYAEAQFHLGNEDVAREYLNKVRSRASVSMPPIPATTTGDDLLKRLRNERRVELAFEGHRYFDVRRWKIADQTEIKPVLGMQIIKDAVTGTKSYEFIRLPITRPATFDPKFYLLPIPRDEVDKTGGVLVNNPGY